MSDVESTVRLHESTVQDAEALSMPRTAKKSKQVRVDPPVFSVQVDPELWAGAMKAADGDVRRIEVVSAVELIVHNNEGWRR